MLIFRKQSAKLRARIIASILVSTALLLSACTEPPSVLKQIKSQGELVVLTRTSPTTYYQGPEGPTGLEYDLASLFAKRLGVKLKIVTPDRFSAILPMLAQREAHLAAAGLTITEDRKKRVRFGPAYQYITQQLVYRSGTQAPASIENLQNSYIEVIGGSSHAEHLKKMLVNYPDVSWQENFDVESEELLSLVYEKELDYTVADSNELALNQNFFPELRVAFDISQPQPLAWAFPKGGDNSLYLEAMRFFEEISSDGALDQILERYYGHVQKFDYVGTRKFIRHIEKRLPHYLDTFKQAALNNDLDWRLLAAVGYQESHWNHRAISPTGVRGIMMLTRNTAADMGIVNRVDPQNSINGGAQYFGQLKKRIPAEIAEPDRTWFALAAYNIGIGHLEDARAITKRLAGDPNKWMDVKKNLPLLMQKRWYSQTNYGYARGKETVQYVENIRIYYDLLVRKSEAERARTAMIPVKYSVAMPEVTLSPTL